MRPRKILGLILREALHRWTGSALAVVAVGLAVAACVVLAMTGEASERETRRVTRDIGFNLRIFSRAADLEAVLAGGVSPATMPEDVLRRLSAPGKVVWNHLIALLEGKVQAAGVEVILSGISAEVCPPGEKKAPMSFAVEAGTVLAGHAAAQKLGLKEGGEVEIKGERFRVVRCLSETGTGDDIRLFGLLSDVQRVLGQPGRIGSIQAIDCLCLLPAGDPAAVLREELERAAPEATLILDRKKADARALQRRTAEGYAAFAVPFIVAVCAAWISVLIFLNVRERAVEIGILRALGHRGPAIAALFLGKAALLAVPGALLGFAAGTAIALGAAPEIFLVTARSMEVRPDLLGWALLGAPLLAALAAYPPAMWAVARDPAAVLREE